MPKEVRPASSHRTSPLSGPQQRRASLNLPSAELQPRHHSRAQSSSDVHQRGSFLHSHARNASESQGISSGTRATSTWSPEDDDTLMSARASGLNWGPIATKFFPSKTANACRKRHERLMERRNAEDWDGVRLETLAREYMEVRREMWEILGRRVGEKWQVVEAKCMEKGLKNLQSAYRSQQRKERAGGGGMEPASADDDDSGIGFEDDAEGEADEDGADSVGGGSADGNQGAARADSAPYEHQQQQYHSHHHQQQHPLHRQQQQQQQQQQQHQQHQHPIQHQHQPQHLYQLQQDLHAASYAAAAAMTSLAGPPDFGRNRGYSDATMPPSSSSIAGDYSGVPPEYRRGSAGSAASAATASSVSPGYHTLPGSSSAHDQQQAAQGLHDLRSSSRRGNISIQSMLSPAHE